MLLEVLSGRDVSSFTRFYVTLLQTRNKYHAIKRFSQLAQHAIMSFSMFRYSGPTWCEEKLGFLNGKVSEGIHLICRWVSGPYTGTVKGPVLRMSFHSIGPG